jgi:DNA uptake protein ComE-like DNA-binding protein
MVLLLFTLSVPVRAVKQDARVDVNAASVDELLRLPGITRIWAARIVRYRPYHSKLDLLNEGVVTPKVYSRISDQIVAHRMAK